MRDQLDAENDNVELKIADLEKQFPGVILIHIILIEIYIIYKKSIFYATIIKKERRVGGVPSFLIRYRSRVVKYIVVSNFSIGQSTFLLEFHSLFTNLCFLTHKVLTQMLKFLPKLINSIQLTKKKHPRHI